MAKPEVREKMRQAHLGYKYPPEQSERHRQAMQRPETREKNRQANLGRKHSLEIRQRMREARLRYLSTRGRVENGGYIAQNGYHVIVMFGHQYQVQRLVWEETNGPIPEGHVIHHINGIRDDNRLENLALMTRGEHTTLHKSNP